MIASRRDSAAGGSGATGALPEILIDGPYGAPGLNVDHYSHILLVAGGIGVTPIACTRACTLAVDAAVLLLLVALLLVTLLPLCCPAVLSPCPLYSSTFSASSACTAAILASLHQRVTEARELQQTTKLQYALTSSFNHLSQPLKVHSRLAEW